MSRTVESLFIGAQDYKVLEHLGLKFAPSRRDVMVFEYRGISSAEGVDSYGTEGFGGSVRRI